MPSSLGCGLIYLGLSAVMLIPAIVPWAAIPLESLTSFPTTSPTFSPTNRPSWHPTISPTRFPSVSPTWSPSRNPSRAPTTRLPTWSPSSSPTTSLPTRAPTTSAPSLTPTTTSQPSGVPTTNQPSKSPFPARRLASTDAGEKSAVRSSAVISPDSLGRQLQSSDNGGGGDIRLLWLLWLWPCISCFLMGICYLLDDPRDVTRHKSYGAMLLGKEMDGSMRWYCVLPMLPVLVPLWLVWLIRHSTCLRNERPYVEVVPGIYMGRFPIRVPFSKWSTADTFPAEAAIIVDLVAEMPVFREVYKTRRYLGIPTLDQCAPNVEALREVGSTLAFHDERSLLSQGVSNFRRLESHEDIEGEGVRVKGAIHVFCANGRGRSTAFMLVLLVMHGDCETVEQALELIRRVRPQINPKEDQIQSAREAVAVWRAEQRGKEASPSRSTMEPPNKPPLGGGQRRRENSNAEVVEIPESIFNLEEEEFINQKEAPVDVKSEGAATASRKRGQSGAELDGASFYCVVPSRSETFTLRITRSELLMIATEASRHLEKETGGDLFGKMLNEGEAKSTTPTLLIHHVIGPGPKSTLAQHAFVQDQQYLRFCRESLGDLSLDHIGEWHSHHGSELPSEGDMETIQNLLTKTAKSHHVLIIANVLKGSTAVAIGAFLFTKGSPKSEYKSGVIQIVDENVFSYDHAERRAELRMIKKEVTGTPLPESTLESTESRNIIDLSLA